jgi:hypothetical protein
MKPIFVIFVCMLFIVGPYLSIDILAVSEPNQSENANQSDVQSDEIINKIDVESYTLNIGKKIRTIDNNIRFINIPNFSDLEITITLYNLSLIVYIPPSTPSSPLSSSDNLKVFTSTS